MRAATTRSLTSDLILVLLAVLPLLYVAGVGRGDDPEVCPEEIAKEVHCTSGDTPTAACSEHVLDPKDEKKSCTDKTWTITYPGMFACAKDPTGKNKCVPVTEGTISKTAKCSRVHSCVVNEGKCDYGPEIGVTKNAGLYETVKCRLDMVGPPVP